MKNKYYHLKQLNPNKILKFRLHNHEYGKNYVRQKRGRRS